MVINHLMGNGAIAQLSERGQTSLTNISLPIGSSDTGLKGFDTKRSLKLRYSKALMLKKRQNVHGKNVVSPFHSTVASLGTIALA